MTKADYYNGEDEQFDYDELGNRESVTLRDESVETYAVNYLTNRCDNDQGEDIVCAYDAAGNTTEDHRGYHYEYDYENRIARIYKMDGQNEIDVAEYAYDALGRRIEKKTYDNGQLDETTRYYHNNNWQVLTETNEYGVAQRSYIYGNYIDEVLVKLEDSDEIYYAHDHLYNPVALLDDEGMVLERYEYDAYGKPTIWDAGFTSERSTSNYDNPYLFTGRRVDTLDDENLTLQYSRNRYYEYDTGRFYQHDPLGIIPNALKFNYFEINEQYQSGLNLYNYVSSNPVVSTDPTGMIFCCKRGRRVKQRNSRQCCKDFIPKRDALNKKHNVNIMGTIICCDGRKVICNWFPIQRKNPGYDKETYFGELIIRSCATTHESKHTRHIQECPKICPHLDWSKFKPGQGRNEAECSAYKAELECLKLLKDREVMGCPSSEDPTTCEKIVNDRIKFVEKQIKHYCKNSTAPIRTVEDMSTQYQYQKHGFLY